MKNVKRSIGTLLLVIVLALTGYVTSKTLHQIKQSESVTENIKDQIPTFKAELLNKKILTKNQISGDRPTIILYVHPECDHCIHEAKELTSKANDLLSTNLIMLSPASLNELADFNERFALTKTLPTLKIARIPYKEAATIFGFSSIPSALIFDKFGHLIKQFKGEVSVDKLLINS